VDLQVVHEATREDSAAGDAAAGAGRRSARNGVANDAEPGPKVVAHI
jgi:hypothetical protein